MVGMTGQCSNFLSRASPDEAHQIKTPTVAEAMVGEVGMTGQSSNFANDLENIGKFAT